MDRQQSSPASASSHSRTRLLDEVRERFTELYYHQDLPLPKVKNDYFGHINASPSAWKRKIKEWNLNNKRERKREEMMVIIRKSRSYAAQGREQRFMVRGKYYTVEDAYRYFKRKGVNEEYWADYVFPDIATPEDVQVETTAEANTPEGSTPLTPETSDGHVDEPMQGPMDEMSDVSFDEDEVEDENVDRDELEEESVDEAIDEAAGEITAPTSSMVALRGRDVNPDTVEYFEEHLRVQERLEEERNRKNFGLPISVFPSYLQRASENFLKSIIVYYPQRLRSPDCTLATRHHDVDTLYPSMKFGGLFFVYHNLRGLKKYAEAHSILVSAFGMVDELLTVQDPRLLTYLLETLVFCRAYGHQELANDINKYFVARSREILGRHHPITIFSAALLHPDRTTQNGFVERGLEKILVQFRECVPSQNQVETMRLLLTGATILKHQGDYYSASSFLDQLLPMYQEAYEEQSYQTVHCLTDRANILISMGAYAEADALIFRAMKAAEGIWIPNELAESRIRCEMAYAELKGAQGDQSEQKRCLRVAIEFGRTMQLDDTHWIMTSALARLSELP